MSSPGSKRSEWKILWGSPGNLPFPPICPKMKTLPSQAGTHGGLLVTWQVTN